MIQRFLNHSGYYGNNRAASSNRSNATSNLLAQLRSGRSDTISQEYMRQRLQGWCDSHPSPNRENTQTARDRILSAHRNRSTDLDLRGLGLRTIPYEVRFLLNLERINLRDNCLQNFPRVVGYLSNLRELDLRGNLLQEPPREVRNPRLQRLLISDNLFTLHPEQALRLSNLQRSDFSGNQPRNDYLVIRDLLGSQRRLELDLNEDFVEPVIEPVRRHRLHNPGNIPNSGISASLEIIQIEIAKKIVKELYLSEDQKNSVISLIELNSGLKEFFRKICNANLYKDNESRENILQPTLKYICEHLLAEDEKKGHMMAMLTTSIGNCSTPINNLLHQIYTQSLLETGRPIEDLRPILEKEVVRDYINSKLNKSISEHRDPIECLESLLNILYDSSDTVLLDKSKKYCQPSRSSFSDLYKPTKQLKEAFLDLVAKPVTTSERESYARDDAKVDEIWESYQRNVLGVRTEKDVFVERAKAKLEKEILERDSCCVDLELLGHLVSLENIYKCIKGITDTKECEVKLEEYHNNALKQIEEKNMIYNLGKEFQL